MAHFRYRLLALLLLLGPVAGAQQPPSAPSRPSPAPLARPPTPYVPAPPSAAAQEAVRLARTSCQAEDFDDRLCEQAVRRLEAVVRDEPRQLEAQLALAEAVWNQAFRQPEGSAQRAQLRQRSLELYQRLVDLGLPDARPYYSLSLLRREPEVRLQLLRRTVELEPKHPEAHKDLAWLLLEQGQVEQAMREYRTHLSVRPFEGREEALENLGFAQKLGEQGRIREAAQVYDAIWDALRGEPRAERCQLFKSMDLDPYERIGARFARQVRELRAACSDMAHMERAMELVHQGQTDEAIAELERQIQQNPAPAEPYLALERIYLERGQVDQAAGTITRYFQQEQDVRERCRHFRTLAPRTARALEPSLLGALERQCRQSP